MQSCCATIENTGMDQVPWQQLSAALSITEPQGSVCDIFSHQHSNTIDCPQSISRKKHSCFLYHSNWDEEHSCCDGTELHPGPSNDLGHGTD